jgi:hypothetical protein
MSKIKKTNLTQREQEQIDIHLKFINHISQISIKSGYRAIIGGGYAVDGSLGSITHFHDDIDIQLYGEDVITPKLLRDSLLRDEYSGLTIEDKGRNDYWHKFFIDGIGAEIYYIRVAYNPFSESKIVIKSDGKYSEEHDYDTKMIILQGVRYEIQSPVIELVDKLYKRDYKGDLKQSKHVQDIFNLKLITNPQEVQERLNNIILRNSTY